MEYLVTVWLKHSRIERLLPSKLEAQIYMLELLKAHGDEVQAKSIGPYNNQYAI